jgi:hypothetical protein
MERKRKDFVIKTYRAEGTLLIMTHNHVSKIRID